jgi:hypothetical protein
MEITSNFPELKIEAEGTSEDGEEISFIRNLLPSTTEGNHEA